MVLELDQKCRDKKRGELFSQNLIINSFTIIVIGSFCGGLYFLQNYYIMQICGIIIAYSGISMVICLILGVIGISPVLLSYIVPYFQVVPTSIGIIIIDCLLVVRKSKFRRRIVIDLALMLCYFVVWAVIYPLLGTKAYDLSTLYMSVSLNLSVVVFQGFDILLVLGWRRFRKIYKCSNCGEKAPFILTDHKLGERKTHKIPFCLDHFIEAFRTGLIQSESTFIFLQKEKYHIGYLFLTLNELQNKPLLYSEAEVNQIASILHNKGNNCRNQDGPADVLMIEDRLIGNPTKKPLIKDEWYLGSSEAICFEHFLRVLRNQIQMKQFFEINLPHGREGIYIPRAAYDYFHKY